MKKLINTKTLGIAIGVSLGIAFVSATFMSYKFGTVKGESDIKKYYEDNYYILRKDEANVIIKDGDDIE